MSNTKLRYMKTNEELNNGAISSKVSTANLTLHDSFKYSPPGLFCSLKGKRLQ